MGENLRQALFPGEVRSVDQSVESGADLDRPVRAGVRLRGLGTVSDQVLDAQLVDQMAEDPRLWF